MAHSYIEVHDNEADAFAHFAVSHPDNVILLIDTYDTRAGARKVVELAPKLAARGITVKAVRLDSGDLGALAREVRVILDRGGCPEIGIFGSGSLDEQRVLDLVAGGAPIDGFGIGTRLDVSADAPYLDCAYKLEAYAGIPRRKISPGKATWPGAKQIYRRYDENGRMVVDRVALATEPADGEALLKPVMLSGRPTETRPTLSEIRQYCASQIGVLPQALRGLQPPKPGYPVEISTGLRALAEQCPGGSG